MFNWELLFDVLRNAILVTGLVMVMMMTIEYINVQSAGRWFASLSRSKVKQVLVGSFLGTIPGCVGGFAAVSLYSHGLISIGALVAAMIASSGDEAFVMLAMIPDKALLLFGLLFVFAFVCGLLVDSLYKGKVDLRCEQEFEVHHGADNRLDFSSVRHPSKEKILITLALVVFAIAIFSGVLEHDHAAHIHTHECSHEGHHHHEGGLNLLDERWMNILFGCVSLVIAFLTAVSNEHFVKDHILGHVIRKHCLSIFLWTLGALAVIQFGLQYLDIEHWIKDNAFYMIVLAALIGLIPESGPHLLFVTLFASGVVPFSVLFASSISQDGHTALPLLASDRKSFLVTKLINMTIAIIAGGILLLFGL